MSNLSLQAIRTRSILILIPARIYSNCIHIFNLNFWIRSVIIVLTFFLSSQCYFWLRYFWLPIVIFYFSEVENPVEIINDCIKHVKEAITLDIQDGISWCKTAFCAPWIYLFVFDAYVAVPENLYIML